MAKEDTSVLHVGGDPAATAPNRRFKDTVFRMLFRDRENLLSLYNALNGTAYTDTGQLEIVTLENAIYMNIKNDLAFLFMGELSLYAHQSTVNPNLPVRGLFYAASEYEKLVQRQERSLYGSRLIKLPAPNFVVFYNGVQAQPERQTLRLSDSYELSGQKPRLELEVTVLNIHPGQNRQITDHCPMLQDYMLYVSRVQEYCRETDIRTAVNRAVNECIREGILRDFLLKNKSEVIRMSIFEYDEEREMRLIRQEEREQGLEQGKVIAYYEMNLSTHEIAVKMQLPEEEIRKIIEQTLTD